MVTNDDLRELLCLPAVADHRSQRSTEELLRHPWQIAVPAVAGVGPRRTSGADHSACSALGDSDLVFAGGSFQVDEGGVVAGDQVLGGQRFAACQAGVDAGQGPAVVRGGRGGGRAMGCGTHRGFRSCQRPEAAPPVGPGPAVRGGERGTEALDAVAQENAERRRTKTAPAHGFRQSGHRPRTNARALADRRDRTANRHRLRSRIHRILP
ncbi:hypothetical protein [Kitasatospora sp. NPDC096140]|uniref:hypothetical protein n=1 Tax=Kitasatospora sp. NPDC096140 TaxID=3155425 RepID=UPI00332B63E9